MDTRAIESTLERAEAQVNSGEGLAGTGFWKAVASMRAEPVLAARYAERVGRIDRRAFENKVRLRVPAAVGTFLLAAGTSVGIVAVALSTEARAPMDVVLFLIGFGALDVFPHSLTHWVVGRLVGIGFTHYFIGGPPPPRPGAKTDYATYLRTSPRRRALMHASGAITTKLVPFLLLPVAAAADLPVWVFALLVVVGLAQIATDIMFSTKTSDWKKVRRELSAAGGARAPRP